MSKSNQHKFHARDYVTLKPSSKRKEMDGGVKAHLKKSTPSNTNTNTTKTTTTVDKVEAGAPDNKLLAGYLAHEFLTQGTLFGKKWDPARAEAVAVTSSSRFSRNNNSSSSSSSSSSASLKKEAAEPEAEAHPSYSDVAHLLKSGEVHIPGIVNPTQLAQWLHQM